MPITRSITRMSAPTTSPVVNIKRKRASNYQSEVAVSDSDSKERARSSKKSKSKSKAKPAETEEQTAVPRPLVPSSGEELAPIPAKLTFSLADAKDHLVRVDRRFGDVFSRLPCKPFERLESVHPFRLVFLLRFLRASRGGGGWG